ncbi:MAG TPA: ATP12 family protein [Alphaproteobacteria bacterium]|nr:ATP12 family protein [Alphaproteobacteria bacterium]
MKRFYKEVGVTGLPEGFGVTLDGKPIKTPGRVNIAVPTRALAEGIADEWLAQDTEIKPQTMPLMQLAATVIDHLTTNRTQIEETVVRFCETDMVCYRADAREPAELLALQQALWDPLLDWLKDRHGVTLLTTSGILPITQPRDAVSALADVVTRMDIWRLGAFQAAAASAGSFVIALALVEGRIDADQAFAAAELDAGFEIDRWGEDALATQRRSSVAFDLKAARRFRDLVVG